VVRATEGMRILTFAPGQAVVREGDPSDAFYVIAKGEAIVVERGESGAEQVINTLKEDQYFGELGLLRGQKRNATVRARTSLEVISVSKESFKMLVESSKQTADEIARVASTRVREVAPTR